MQFNRNSVRRLDVLIRILTRKNVSILPNNLRAYSNGKKVTIDDVSKDIADPKNLQNVPRKYLLLKSDGENSLPQSRLRHLRWMLQKDSLGQDMFLLGPPGPNRRQIAMQYLELTQREAEYVALSRDTTEADLKQRREIQQGTAKYFDQSAVRAAIEGRILVLEGIEKAERNVLPVLNNLLENREMHLEDGRFLIPAERYDKLLELHGEEEVKKWRLERVGEGFRVIALGLPVPHYAGSSLDPPLRSRFQARHIPSHTYEEQLENLTAETKVPYEKLTKLLSAAYALASPELSPGALRLPDFPLDSLPRAAKLMHLQAFKRTDELELTAEDLKMLKGETRVGSDKTCVNENNPQLSVHSVLYMLYPYRAFLPDDAVKTITPIFKSFDIDINEPDATVLTNVTTNPEEYTSKIVVITDRKQSEIEVSSGGSRVQPKERFVENDYQNLVLADLMQSHAVSDICIIGPKGCGKSRVANALARALSYGAESLPLYRDVSARELLQRRVTLPGGDTAWVAAPLVRAALAGRMLLLDGLHRLHPSTGAVLHRLVHDRELQLYDGSRLIRHDRYDELLKMGLTKQQLTDSGVLRIHPAFRIIALAEPPTIGQGPLWLTPELLSLFTFHHMRNFTKDEEMYLIHSMFGKISDSLNSMIHLAHTLRTSKDSTLNNLSASLSTRQLLRIANRMSKYPAASAYDTVQRTFLAKFLPNLARNALENVCKSLSISPPETKRNIFSKKNESATLICKVENGFLTIGKTSVPLYKTEAVTKVPDILFYDVPQHIELLEWLLQDFILGNHLLLVGNQGVGKNKIADRLLQLLNRPREYIQLHRDTTVQSLTVQPTVKDGMVVYEDSPLVNAVKYGHVLVVDEADKAPTHVTCILKTLVENAEMILSDGRRIVPKHLIETSTYEDSVLIPMHEDFRMIVLANRPGFPFLGNDFFASLGDLFSCHGVDNPSIESELLLLRQYGPDVPSEITDKLVKAFASLRSMADQGLVTYPYSTREVVNIVKHLQKYPSEDLGSAISNVFDFDRYSAEVGDTLVRVLKESGLPAAGILRARDPLANKHLKMSIDRKSGLDVSAPKHGKVDPKGDPHVGGNTWAGGTGGRDTAGLGGKGGPYRLDAGHQVHQLSDQEKDDIPDHVKKAAKEMNRRAFADRLKEIRMSEYDANLYEQFLGAVRAQVGALRGVLGSLQARATERHWERHQTSGDLDDTKIIEGLTGEEAIYRRRLERAPPPGSQLEKPKLLRLLVDVSGSMYRFNSFDGRLDRSLEAVVLVMEALRGFESRLKYDIWGHSGETHDLELVSLDNPPENEKERLQVIRTMHAHSQFCWSGDNTVQAVENASRDLSERVRAGSHWDEGLLVALSDANLSRYGVPASKLASALTSHPAVLANVVFIGSLGDQADTLLTQLPVGRAFMCMDVSTLPQILQQIFASSLSARPVEG